MYEYIFLNEVWNGVKYMKTCRTPVSCGANLLFDLDSLDRRTLERLLVQEYKTWGERDRPGKGVWPEDMTNDIREARQKGQYDNKIYKGETVIFPDRDSNENGKRLEHYIKENDLGEVTSLSTTNPNTLNKITTYLWVYNGNKLKPATKKKVSWAKGDIVLE